MTIQSRRVSSILIFLLALLALAPRAEAQVTITSPADFGTQSLGGMSGIGLSATGGTPPYTWRVVSGTLPQGLSIRTDLPSYLVGGPSSAALQGVALTPGFYAFSVTATDSLGAVSPTQNCQIRISGLLLKDNFTIGEGFVNQPYSLTFTALRKNMVTGVADPVSPTWAVQPPGLPAGLSLNTATGEVFGAPATSGVYTFQLAISEGRETVVRGVTLNVFDLHFTTPLHLPNATQGVAYDTTVGVDGGTGPYTFAATGLPTGMSMSSGGAITGTTTQRGNFSVSVTVVDSAARAYGRRLALTVVGVPKALPAIQPGGNSPFDDCTYGWPCIRNVNVVNGGKGPFTWSATGLPSGLSIRSASAAEAVNFLTPSDAEIWGNPVLLGTFNVTVTVTDADGATATNTFPLKVSDLAYSAFPSETWTRGVSTLQKLRIIGGPSSPAIGAAAVDGGTLYSGTVVSGGPPAGVAFTSLPATFNGTPTENIQTSARVRYTIAGANPLETTYAFNVGGGTSTIQITTGSNLGAVVSTSTSYSNQLSACCTTNPLTWNVVGGALPSSLSLSPSGLLSGNPSLSAVGQFTFLVQAADSVTPSNFGQRQFTLAIVPNSITTTSPLPPGNVGTPYSTTLQSGFNGSWSLASNSYLPPGLMLGTPGNPCGFGQTCVLSGTPTASGQYSFGITLGGGIPFTRTFSLSIYPAGVLPPVDLTLGNQFVALGNVFVQLTGATGGSGAGYQYSLTPGATPVPGLRVQDGPPFPTFFGAATTAALMGVATTLGVHNTSIRVTDSVGNFFDRPISVTVSALHILSQSTLPKATIGAPYSFTLVPTGGTAYSWSATGLPAGLNINSSTGVISGTPTGTGTSTASPNITLTDLATSLSVTINHSLTVNGHSITSSVLPQGTVGVPYSTTLVGSGCTIGCSWSIQGTLPTANPSFQINSTTGVLTGTPTNTFNGTITVNFNGTSGAVQKLVSLQINAATPQLLQLNAPSAVSSYFSLAGGVAVSLGASGGAQPYTWSIDSGTLPPGVSLQGPGELLGGTLAPGFTYLAGRAMQLGVYTFTVRVTDNAGAFTTKTLTWTVSALNSQYSVLPPTGSSTIANGTPFSSRLLVIGGSAAEGTGNYTFTNTAPLPFGLSLDSSTGVVSGTPTEQVNNLSVPIQVLDNVSLAKLVFNVSFTIGGSTTVSFGGNSNLGVQVLGATLNTNVQLSGGTAPYTVTALSPLPPGLTLLTGSALFSGAANNSFSIAGSPLATGVFSFTLQAQDSVGNTRLRTYTVSVVRFGFSQSTAMPDVGVGEFFSETLLTYNNAGTVNWSVTPGFSLPPGVTLAGNVLSGTPTAASSSYTFSLDATDPTDPAGIVRTASFTLRVSTYRITSPQIIPVVAVIGSPFSYQLTSTAPAGTTWSLSNSTLPQSYTLSSSGVLSTPEAPNVGSISFTALMTPPTGVPQTRRFTWFTRFPNPQILDIGLTSTQIGDLYVGAASLLQLTASGGAPPYSWSIAPGSSLPPGLSLLPWTASGTPPNGTFNPGSTTLVGVASTAGQYTFDLIVTDTLGAQMRRTYSLKIVPFTLLSGTLKPATAGVAYSQQLTAVGGSAPYTFTTNPVSLSQDMLPPGLSLSSSGLLSGTATSTGAYAFFVTVQEAGGATYTRRINFNVPNASGLQVSNFNPANATLGIGRRSSMSLGVTTSGPFNGYSWSVAPGSSLPPGLVLENEGGDNLLAGFPTASGPFTFTLRATDVTNASNFADHTFTFRAAPMQVVAPATEAYIAPDLPNGEVGVPYSFALKVAGGTAPYTFVASPFAPLPPGLTLSSDGILSGTPETTASVSVVAIITDASGHVLIAPSMPLAILPPGTPRPLNRVTGIELGNASVGVPYALALDPFIRGGTPPFSWSVAPGSALPPGLVLLPGANGVSTYIGGVPTMPSADDDEGEPVSLVVTDGTQTLTFTMNLGVSPLAFSPDTLPPAKVGVPYLATFTPAGVAPPYSFFAEPRFALPPGLTLSQDGVLQGTPTTAGNFPMAVILMNDETGMGRLIRFAVDNAAGDAPAVSVSPTPIQIFHTTGAPDPAPTPIAINTTSSAFAYGLSLAGIPGASLSSSSGNAPGVSNLNWNLAGVGLGTYHGILGVRAQSTNLFDYVPVTLTVSVPPPCTYSVNPVSSSIGAAGGSGSFGVIAGAGCAWTAVSQAPAWLTVTSATSGTGSATIDFTAAANPDVSPRTGTVDVQGQTYTVTQFGSSCSFAISPTSLSAPASGGSAIVTITASSASCPWTASGLSASPSGGMGNGSVTVTVPPNGNATSVQLNATIADQPFTVAQTGAGCSVALSPLEASSPSGGGTGSVQVTPVPGCSYNTVTGPAWISVTSGGSGNGAGTLVYDVQPNSTTTQRSGTLAIGGHSFQITQDGVPCSVTIDTSALGSPYDTGAGLVGTIGVTTNGPNCPWVAGSGAGWASLSPTSGSTSATIHVSVQSNAGSITPRSTNLTVAGQTVSITQIGIDCSYSLQSTTGSAPAQGGVGTVGVVAPGACAWTSSTNDPSWLTILSSGSGGSANVLFSALPNPDATSRTGTLTIANITYTVTQAAASCSYTLTPSSATAVPGAGTGSVSYSSTPAGCTPSVVSYAGWVTATPAGPGSVDYTVQPNPTAAARSATIQVGDKTFTITQFGATCGFSFNSYGSLFAQPGGPGSILGSSTGCTASPGSDQSFVTVPIGPVGPGLFTLPFTVAQYLSLNPNIRFAKIVIGGQIHIVKQTSW